MCTCDEFVIKLENALNKHQLDKVKELMAFDVSSCGNKNAEKITTLLRGKKQHVFLEQVTSVFRDTLPENTFVKLHRAQSLIELGRRPQALALLKNLESLSTNDKRLNSEIHGLIGRIHKQNFIESNEQDKEKHLQRSINQYYGQWYKKMDDYRWHGINLVALASRAKKENIELDKKINVKSLAQQIVSEIQELDKNRKANTWDYATAFEGCIALNDNEMRDMWLKKYIHDHQTDAFELNSTLRQLREVWNIENTPTGEEVIPVIEHAILSKTGGVLEIKDPTIDESSNKVFEAVYGNEGSVQKRWLESLFSMLNAVARISHNKTGENVGTGFLIHGRYINDKYANEALFVTNSHVISEQINDHAALRTINAQAEFTTLPNRPMVSIGEQVFYSPKTDLDISVHKIKHPKEALVLDPTIYMPNVPKGDKEAPMRIYVIGHPKGGEISITLYGNKLKDIKLPYFHYESPTEGGNSGSPVFNRKLDLIGLHHAAITDKKINEGIAFSSILITENINEE